MVKVRFAPRAAGAVCGCVVRTGAPAAELIVSVAEAEGVVPTELETVTA